MKSIIIVPLSRTPAIKGFLSAVLIEMIGLTALLGAVLLICHGCASWRGM